MEEKIAQLIEQMTVTEKVSLCSGGSDWSTQPIERLNIPEIFMSDGPHGVRWMDPSKLEGLSEGFGLIAWTEMDPEKGMIELLFPATCFPTSATTASSWDRDLLEEIGRALGQESQHHGLGLLLGPGTNIKRHPLTGRNFEYFSEDPCLAGELAAAYVHGVQSQGVGTSLKHFACNNAEFERLSMSSDVDERALREVYLAAFERVIKQARPWTVMSSYNRINGVDASHNQRLLSDILKDEWGFDGVVISDWWAVRDRVRAAAAGLDIEMPPNANAEQALLTAVEQGDLPQETLNELVGRILRLVFRCQDGRRAAVDVDFDAHDQLAQRAAAESAVLLKNAGGLLPLETEAKDKIAVIGRMAVKPRYQGVGSSLVNPWRLSNALEALQAAAAEPDLVTYAEGYTAEGRTEATLLQEAQSSAAAADVAIIFAGLPVAYEMESWDRRHMDLPHGHVELIRTVAAVQPNTVVVLSNGSCVSLTNWIDAVPAVLEGWLGGQAGGPAIADLIFGAVNPSGKLAVTVPRRLEDTPAFLHFPGENNRHLYGEGVFVGYRYYDKRQLAPLFPFGFGLSYTSFALGDLVVDKPEFSDQESVTVTCTVTNTGRRPGKEVVQLYVTDRKSRLARPPKELKGFVKVALAPEESQTVSFALNDRDFSYYDPALGRWVAESGAFDILIGTSAADIHLRQTVTLHSTQNNVIPFSHDSYIKDFLDNQIARAIFIEFLMGNGLLGRETPESTIEGLRNIFMPIATTLETFSQGAITPGLIDELLADVNQSLIDAE